MMNNEYLHNIVLHLLAAIYSLLIIIYYKFFTFNKFIFRYPSADMPYRGDVLHPGDGVQAVDLVQGDLRHLPLLHRQAHTGHLPDKVRPF